MFRCSESVLFASKITKYFNKPETILGKVKWFDGKKGYGFITGEDGKEVFVHYSGIVKDGFKALNEKQEVEYELGEGSKGIQAINVKVVE